MTVIAHRQPAEAESVRKSLNVGDCVHVITDPAQFDQYSHRCEVLLLDAQFTDDHAMGFLKAVRARGDLPVVVTVPADRPEWRSKASRLVRPVTY